MAAIKDIIPDVIRGLSTDARVDLAVVWQQLCPRGAAVVDFKEGKALVHVDSSARLVHLNARRAQLLKAVQAKCPQVKELRFKVGKINN